MERITNSDYMENHDSLNEAIDRINREGTQDERIQLSRFLGSLGLYNALEDNPNIVRGEE